MKDPYILCWGIQSSIDRTLHLCWDNTNSSGKSSSVSKWFQGWQNPYIVCGDIQIPTEKESSVLKCSQRLQNFTSFEGRFRPKLKRQFSIKRITKMTETNILCRDISIPNWRRQFSIEIIPNMTETYIPFGDIQIPIDRTLHLLLGHSNSNWKNSSVSKWFQTWQNLTFRFCVATFKFQLKNAVQYWTDFKDHRTLHPLWEHSNPKWKRQFSIEIISKMTERYICGDI